MDFLQEAFHPTPGLQHLHALSFVIASNAEGASRE